MSAESSRAVFLSYASQDAEAARRICEALRSGGVEVWFDQNELVGGDAWDAKIRKQIKECALFVPIISASTQARTEGYFRLEWRLADQRTHLMAKGRPFLLPVVIDQTRDADAQVPDSFTEVQWTRLNGKDTPESLATRVARLLGGSGLEAGRPRPAQRDEGVASPAERASSRSWSVPAITGVTLVVAVAVFFALRQRRNPEDSAKPLAKSIPAAEAGTEVSNLLRQARGCFENPNYTHDDLALAEELCQKATKLDPTNAEVWAVYAELNGEYVGGGYDISVTRLEAARSHAERALTLAPASTEAQFAMASYLRRLGGSSRAEAERLLRRLAERTPNDPRVLIGLGKIVRDQARAATRPGTQPKLDEALAWFARAAAIPGGRAEALRERGWALRDVSRFAEAEASIDESLALQPSRSGFSLKVMIARNLGKLDEAAATLGRLPADYLRNDQGACVAAMVWLWRREPEKALEALRPITHDYVSTNQFIGPTRFLTGTAHQIAGRMAAAQAEWRAALAVIEQRLIAQPNDQVLLGWKAELLGTLGEREAGAQVLRVWQQLRGRDENEIDWVNVTAAAALGRNESVIAYFANELRDHNNLPDLARLRYEPAFEAIRTDLRVQALLDESARAPAGTKADDKSVAVLAFADLSAAHDSEYFSDGISEELLNVLAKVPGLKVTARTSSFFFKGKNQPIPEIARQLGVGYVIEGSVQHAGDQIKITAQLIKAADGFHVWSDTFKRDAKDVFAVEEEIAGLIAKQLSLQLGVSSATASVNPLAFELYLQGRQQWNLRTAPALAKAEDFFNRALALDPKLIRAHAGLADVAVLRGQAGKRLDFYPDRQAPALAAIVARIEQALALDPNLAENHTSLGGVRLIEWDFAGAERELRQAIVLNPNYGTAHHWLGRVLTAAGRMDEGLAELKLAASIDPLSSRICDNYAFALMLAGRLTESLAAIDRSLAVSPGTWQATNFKIDILLRLHRDEEALALVREIGAQDPTYRIGPPPSLLARVGLRREAESVFKMSPDGPNDAGTLLALDRREEALATLTADRIGVLDLDSLLYNPMFDRIRGEPRFVRAIEGIGLTEAHTRAQAWRAAHPPEKLEAKK